MKTLTATIIACSSLLATTASASTVTYNFDLTFVSLVGSIPAGALGTGQLSFEEAESSSGQPVTPYFPPGQPVTVHQTDYRQTIIISYEIANTHYSTSPMNAAFVQDLDPTHLTYDLMRFGSSSSDVRSPRVDIFGNSNAISNTDLTAANVDRILAQFTGAGLYAGSQDYARMSNITLASPVPEPASLTLIGAGFLVIKVALRRSASGRSRLSTVSGSSRSDRRFPGAAFR